MLDANSPQDSPYRSIQQGAKLTGLSHDTFQRRITDPAWIARIKAALPPDHPPIVVNHGQGSPSTAIVRKGRKHVEIARKARTKLLVHINAINAYLRLVEYIPTAPVQSLSAQAGAA